MKDIDCLKQLSDDLFGVGDRQRPAPVVELIGEHLVAELEDAVDLFSVAVLVFDDVKQAHELLIVDQLAKQGDLPHCGVVDPVGHVLHRQDKVRIRDVVGVKLSAIRESKPYLE